MVPVIDVILPFLYFCLACLYSSTFSLSVVLPKFINVGISNFNALSVFKCSYVLHLFAPQIGIFSFDFD